MFKKFRIGFKNQESDEFVDHMMTQNYQIETRNISNSKNDYFPSTDVTSCIIIH